MCWHACMPYHHGGGLWQACGWQSSLLYQHGTGHQWRHCIWLVPPEGYQAGQLLGLKADVQAVDCCCVPLVVALLSHTAFVCHTVRHVFGFKWMCGLVCKGQVGQFELSLGLGCCTEVLQGMQLRPGWWQTLQRFTSWSPTSVSNKCVQVVQQKVQSCR